MKVIVSGHTYSLATYDGWPGIADQELHFMMRNGGKYPDNPGIQPGTNCQEVLRVLIDRCHYLDKQIPAAETHAAIHLMRTALLQFEIRAKRMKNKMLFLPQLRDVESIPTCSVCGHILCAEEHQ